MRFLTTEEVQNYGLWLQSAAIFFALIGVFITVNISRRIARRRATIDLIMMEQSNKGLIEERHKFIELKNKGHLVGWSEPGKMGSEESTTIRAMLNRYELVAIGMKEKTLDKRIYKLMYRTTVVRDWIACKAYVMELRHAREVPTLFCEFEALAKSWANATEKPNC